MLSKLQELKLYSEHTCDKISLKGPLKKKVNFKINAFWKHLFELHEFLN